MSEHCRIPIVECAIEVIAELGFAQASIRKIADRVGIAMSTVLYHFGNRDNLVDAVVDGRRQARRVHTRVARLFRQPSRAPCGADSARVAPRPFDWRPPQALTDFLAEGPAPVFVGFGNTVTTASRAEHMSDIVAHVLRQASLRGVVQAGWAGLDVAGDDVLTVGDVPYDWLFPRMSAVAHQCGAGTAAAALRAGVPQIGIPGLGDQAFWANRLYEIGASAGTIPQRKLSAEGLATVLQAAIGDGSLRAATRQLAGRLAEEDGSAAVLAAVKSVTRAGR